jgi:putative ABC transport system ATP-binding protein
MIALHHVSRIFRSDQVETAALTDVSLTIERGEFVAIMGPSGGGKSTLLNVLGTIDRPTGGAYLFEGRDLARLSEARLAEHRAAHLGFIFQSFNLIDDLTIRENIELGLLYRKRQRGLRRGLVEEVMDRVGIGHRADHFPQQLSGGQQQRAAIARAVVGTPSLLLADEPTGNLDSENGQQVMDILKSLNQDGVTVIMVTHSQSQADQAGRRIQILDGRLALSVARVTG